MLNILFFAKNLLDKRPTNRHLFDFAFFRFLSDGCIVLIYYVNNLYKKNGMPKKASGAGLLSPH